MEEKSKNTNTVVMSKSKKIAFFAVFVALVIVVQVLSTVLGQFFRIVAPTLAFVPILLAIVTLGYWQGVALGAVFSTVVLIFTASGYDPGSYAIFNYSPVLTVLLIYVKGCLAPVVAGIIYKVLKNKMPKGSIWVCSAILPIINTGVFCLGMLLFYRGYFRLQNITDFKGILYTVFIAIAGVNFLIEFFINIILTPVVTDVKKVFDKGNY